MVANYLTPNSMQTFFQKLIRVGLSGLMTMMLLSGLTVQASYSDDTAVFITDDRATPKTFNPEDNEETDIEFCLNTEAYTEVTIYKNNEIITILEEDDLDRDCYSYEWDGTYGEDTEEGDEGDTVDSGTYTYKITAENDHNSDMVSGKITVSNDDEDEDNDEDEDEDDDLEIIDVSITNQTFDPWDEQEATFEFSLNKSAEITLKIYDEDDNKVATLINGKDYSKGDHEIDWDGTDNDDDIQDEGSYYYEFTAKTGGEKFTYDGKVKIKKGADSASSTKKPRIENLFVTKDSFDPANYEKTYIVFSLTREADTVITVYDENDKKMETLINEKDVAEGYKNVKWDGSDLDEGRYTIEVEVENSKGSDKESIEVEIVEEENTGKKPNVFKDLIHPESLVINSKNQKLTVDFRIDKESEVTVEITDNGELIQTIIQDKELEEGEYFFQWDGRDKYGKQVTEGFYKYKISAVNKYGKDYEKGQFYVDNSKKDGGLFPNEGNCGVFYDVPQSYEFCDAIKWAKINGIFEGYSDGTFRPSEPITRVEALKVILKAFNVNILTYQGGAFGFYDLTENAWYMPYIKTALTLGIANGYADSSFRPNNYVSRIEALKLMLNTAVINDNLIVPVISYGQPYPDTPDTPDTKWYLSYAWFSKKHDLVPVKTALFPSAYMSRGAMAEMLYRYYTNVR